MDVLQACWTCWCRDGVGKGSWWYYWTLLAAHGPGVVVERKGTCCCTRTRDVSTSTPNSTLYYLLRPCEHLSLARRVLFTSSGLLYQERISILLLRPGDSTNSPRRRQNMHQATQYAHICRPSEPSSTHAVPRDIRCQSSHLHRAVPFPV